MGDFHFGGTDEESAEIKKLNAEVVSHTSLLSFDMWEG
jgi:pre-mRNA-processing factor 39